VDDDTYRNIKRVEDYRPVTDPYYRDEGVPAYPQTALLGAAIPCALADPTDCFEPGVTFGPRCALSGSLEDNVRPTYDPVDNKDCAVLSIQDNCYLDQHTPGEHDTTDLCTRIGFKNVQAKRVWHGRFGFLSHDPFAPGNCVDDIKSLQQPGTVQPGDTLTPLSDCNMDFERLQLTPRQTKYCRMVASGYTNNGDYPPASAENSCTLQVNKLSGVLTQTIQTPVYDGVESERLARVALDHIAENAGHNAGVRLAVEKFASQIAAIKGMEHPGVPLPPSPPDPPPPATFRDYVFGGSYPEFTCVVTNNYGDDGAGGYQTFTEFSLLVNTVTGFYRYESSLIDGNYVAQLYFIEQLSCISDTSLRWYAQEKRSILGGDDYNTNVAVDLYDPVHFDEVRNDAYALLGAWDMADHKRYPWRKDGYVTIAPLVKRNECTTPKEPVSADGKLYGDDYDYLSRVQVAVTETGLDGVEGTDWVWLPWREAGYYQWGQEGGAPGQAKPDLYSSSIIGKPMTLGYKGYFDPSHVSWGWCFDTDTYQKYVFPTKAGAWAGNFTPPSITPPVGPYGTGDNSDSKVPVYATHWTENWGGHAVSYGWWANLYADGVFTAQKWAECKLPWRSANFFRPCGEDRFALKAGTRQCVSEVLVIAGGYQLTLTEAGSFPIGSYLFFWDEGNDRSQVYYMPATQSGTTITLMTVNLRYTAPKGAGLSYVGTLRWPTAWPICGKAVVTSAVQGTGGDAGYVIVTAASVPWLRTNDRIDFVKAADDDAVNDDNSTAGWPVVVIDDTHFKIQGALNANMSGYVKSHGAPLAKWNKTTAYNRYEVLTWKHNFRDYAEHVRVWGNRADYGAGHVPPGACSVDVTGIPTTSLDCDSAAMTTTPSLRFVQNSCNGMSRSVYDFACTNHTLAPNDCRPVVIVGTPAANYAAGKDHFELGSVANVHYLPAAMLGDMRYGARWQAAVVQAVPDPFWTEPEADCVTCGEPPDETIERDLCWTEDDGSCATDNCVDPCAPLGTKKYFPHRPMVEARSDLPAGAPTPPSDVYFGWPTLDLLAARTFQQSFPGWETANAPTALVDQDGLEQFHIEYDMNWHLWLRMQECACNSGHPFGDAYLMSLECEPSY
jgi:hypothetical protein